MKGLIYKNNAIFPCSDKEMLAAIELSKEELSLLQEYSLEEVLIISGKAQYSDWGGLKILSGKILEIPMQSAYCMEQSVFCIDGVPLGQVEIPREEGIPEGFYLSLEEIERVTEEVEAWNSTQWINETTYAQSQWMSEKGRKQSSIRENFKFTDPSGRFGIIYRIPEVKKLEDELKSARRSKWFDSVQPKEEDLENAWIQAYQDYLDKQL